jgi:ligand-binding sensor domain-containing protein
MKVKVHPRILINALLAMLSSICALAQGPMLRNYTIADGLPNNSVFCMEIDERGFLWIGTNEGIARFDGTKFTTFSVDNGLRDNSILRMKRDSKDRIWYSTDNGSYGYILHGKLHNGWDHPVLRKYPLNSFIYDITSDPQGNVWMATEKDGIWVWNDTVMTQVFPPGYTVSSIHCTGGEIVAYTDVRGKAASAIIRFEIASRCMISCYQFAYPKPELYNKPSANLHRLGNDQIGGNAQGGAFSIAPVSDLTEGHVIQELKGHGIALGARKYGEDYYVLFQSVGFVRFRLDENYAVKGPIDYCLPGKTVSSMLLDSVGNLWVGTLQHGLMLYQPNGQITPLLKNETQKASIYMSKVIRDTLYFTDSEGNFYRMEGDQPRCLMSVKLQQGSVLDFNPVGNGMVVSMLSSGFIYLPELPKNRIVINMDSLAYLLAFRLVSQPPGYFEPVHFPRQNAYYISTPSIKSFLMMGTDTMFTGTAQGLRLYPLLQDGKITKQGFCRNVGPDLRLLSVAVDLQKRRWTIYTDGLYQYKNGGVYPQTKLNSQFLKVKMTQCASLPDSSLLIATTSTGLIHYFPDQQTWEVINRSNSLIGNRILHICKDSDSTFLVTSSTGIAVLQYDQRKHKCSFSEYKSIQLSHLGALQRLSKNKKNLYVQSTNGIFSLPLENTHTNTRSYPIYITAAHANGSSLPPDEPTELTYLQNNFRFNFVGLDFPSVGRLTYELRLLGSLGDTTWQTTNINEVNYSSLTPGQYQFQVRAIAFDGLPSSNTASFMFTILPPWYKTWWFRTLAVLCLLAAGTGLFAQRLRAVRRRNNMELRLLESEQKALRSQMNPHFIFNSLNSIQRFLATNNPNESIRYLTKFGRLMRSILDHSRASAIAIGEELTALRLYLELEALRTGHKFDYEIVVDPQLDELGDRMPPLLLQPYVENAIWHGIMAKEGKGKISISLENRKGSIHCTVRDNGIGRAKALELKGDNPTGRKSHGMNITAERLALLNRDRPRAITVRISDLTDAQGFPCGTLVEMDIPKDF